MNNLPSIEHDELMANINASIANYHDQYDISNEFELVCVKCTRFARSTDSDVDAATDRLMLKGWRLTPSGMTCPRCK